MVLGPLVRRVWDRLAGFAAIEKRAQAPEQRAAIAQEAQLLEQAHPAFPRLLDVAGAFAQPSAITMELVGGAALSASTTTPSVLADLLTGLEHLHQRGFVHGDLKPDHLWVDERGRGRILDLGLARPVGTPARGGTPRYMPPEQLAGARASVAGDLYSLGRALQEALPTPGPDLRALLAACVANDPRARPSSALACINALGETRRQLDVLGTFARVGSKATLERALAVVERSEGRTLWISAAPGSGRRRFARDLAQRALRAGKSTVSLSLASDLDFAARWAKSFRLRVSGDRTSDLATVASAAARLGLSVIVHAQTAACRQTVQVLGAAIARTSAGALLVLADQELTPTLGSEPAALEQAREEQAIRLFELAGARLDAPLFEYAWTRSNKRIGTLASLARLAAYQPLTSTAAIERALEGLELTPAPPVNATGASLADCELAFRRGDYSRAAALAEAVLRAAKRTDTPSAQLAQALLARSLARSGNYRRASELLVSLSASSVYDRLLRLECLERLGQHREARSAARDLEFESAIGVAALAIGAHASLAMGEPELARSMAERGLARSTEFVDAEPDELGLCDSPREVVGRLLSIQSDVALRQGRFDDSLSFAENALALAVRHDDALLAAQAHARLGAARGLSGDPRSARHHYAEALAAAERAGDVGRLPAFIMNLATAEHGLGDFAAALDHYQEAASLAERLGRKANLLAATVNLAGLWTFLAARVEAETLLNRADELAKELGDAVYRSQSLLLRAELLREVNLPSALELARAAHAGFAAAGAARQALEAELLGAELSLRAGSSERARTLLELHGPELKRAGLEARCALLAGRTALATGEPGPALAHAEKAIRAADGERELSLLARFLGAQAKEALAPGSGDQDAAQARVELRALVATLPATARANFTSTQERRAVERGLERQVSATSLAARGLGPEAQRLLGLVRRLLLEGQEQRVLETALDEAVQLTGAERAFLVLARPRGLPEVAAAHNVAPEALKSASFRFSRSVVERAIKTGEVVVTASALEDPALDPTRSILDLGLRSILAVPIRGPRTVLGALYLDHRIEHGRFGEAERELTVALADIVGIALEKARLVKRAEERADESARQTEAALRDNVEKAREVERLAQMLKRAKLNPEAQGGIVGSSHKLLSALDIARRVAKSDLPVLIRGESGTGKELFARFVHGESARRQGPFVAINCGAVPEALLESELFGHKRGAFTGAINDNPGLFRLADGGTLFLDEIGEMPLRMQTRLLRVLQEGEVRPVGGSETLKVEVRILAATHRNLEQAVGEGAFREDLYYRLLGARVSLPALRERREDILEIAQAILARLRQRYQRSFELSREAETALLRHDWPGNVRELEQTLTRGALLAEGVAIGPENLDLARHEQTRRNELQTFDRALIEQALKAAKGNRTLAAKSLGVSRVTLHRWMKRYDVG